MNDAEREVLEMFPDGNFEDYWLGTPAYDNTRLLDQPGWISLEGWLTDKRRQEVNSWRPEDDAVEALIRHDTERGGGLMGASPELSTVRAGLIDVGQRALDAERRFDRLSRRR